MNMKVLIVISKFLPEYSDQVGGFAIYINFIVNNFVKKKYLNFTGGEEFNSNKSYMIKNLCKKI